MASQKHRQYAIAIGTEQQNDAVVINSTNCAGFPWLSNPICMRKTNEKWFPAS